MDKDTTIHAINNLNKNNNIHITHIKQLLPHRMQHWVNLIEHATSKAYGFRISMCMPKLFFVGFHFKNVQS